ncbi:MAG: type 4a pilus biogenesis protein PilO [Candidatus Obscuribacterales bacterium]|nr:type 4a pilus biogenesis protein PilO [Candidatus Obscuribacterales bacterium]
MQLREKILVCALPFALAAVMWFAVTSQAVTDWQAKDQELKDKSKEQVVLKSKITNLNKLKDDQKKLEVEIEALRASVPKAPDIDLLMIDVERMCQESGMDLVSVQPPGKDKLKEIAQEDKEQQQALEKSGGKLSLGGKNKSEAISGPDKDKDKAKDKDKKDKKAKGKTKEKPKEVLTPEQEAGLNTLLVQCSVTGDYPSFVELMKKLEAYQRVIGINQLEIDLPEMSASDKKKMQVELNKKLDISFLLTTYYLP